MSKKRAVFSWQWVIICLVVWYSPFAAGQETAEDTTGAIIPGQTFFRGVEVRALPSIIINDLQLTGAGINPVTIRNGGLIGAHKVLLDEMSITSVSNNLIPLFSIGPHMIENMTLQTTSHTPEFIGGSSGITMIETPEGGDQIQGYIDYRARSEKIDDRSAIRPSYLNWRAGGPLGEKIRWFTAGRSSSFIFNAFLKTTYIPSAARKLTVSAMIEDQHNPTSTPILNFGGGRHFINLRYNHRIRPDLSYDLRVSHMGRSSRSNTELYGAVRKRFSPMIRIKAGYLGTLPDIEFHQRISSNTFAVINYSPNYHSLFLEGNLSYGRVYIDAGGRFTSLRLTSDAVFNTSGPVSGPESSEELPVSSNLSLTSNTLSPFLRITTNVSPWIKVFGSTGLYHQQHISLAPLKGYFKTEIGARMEVLPGYFVQVTGYDRDLRGSENSILNMETFPSNTLSPNGIQAERDEDYRTLEFMLHKPSGRHLTFKGQYGLVSWEHLRITPVADLVADFPFSRISQSTTINRRHRFMAHMTLHISSNTTASAVLHVSSERTRLRNNVTADPLGLLGRTTRLRDERTDLQVQHAFQIQNAVRLGVFIHIRNAFKGSDQTNRPSSERWIRRGDPVGFLGSSLRQPDDYFNAPRDVFLGVSARW